MINISLGTPNLSAYEFAAMEVCRELGLQAWEYNLDLDGIMKPNWQLVAVEMYKLDTLLKHMPRLR